MNEKKQKIVPIMISIIFQNFFIVFTSLVTSNSNLSFSSYHIITVPYIRHNKNQHTL